MSNVENGLTRSTTTDERGEFVLRFLPPASTASRLSRRDSRPFSGTGCRRGRFHGSPRADDAGRAGRGDGDRRAGSQPLDLASTELATAITETEIRNLPINRRNFLDFALTTPGVTPDRGPQTGAATTSGFSVNGQDPRLNNVLLDGLDDNDPAVGAVRSAVPQEAVREYQVIRAPYSPSTAGRGEA